jgi:Arc/MetJ-type ribon-helix-helix transcriptional regulator
VSAAEAAPLDDGNRGSRGARGTIYVWRELNIGDGAAATRVKVTVSVPHELITDAEARVRSGGAPSLSALVTAALAEKLERDELQAILDEIFRDQPMTDEERDTADRALGL